MKKGVWIGIYAEYNPRWILWKKINHSSKQKIQPEYIYEAHHQFAEFHEFELLQAMSIFIHVL